MVVGAEVIGVLEVCGDRVATIPMDTVQVLEALAVQAATAIGAARVHEHTELLATTDALTHLPNRRRLETDLAQEVAVSSRHSRSEEHTSELQSLMRTSYAVFCLKTKTYITRKNQI